DILYYKGYSHQLKYEFGKAMECYRQYIASGKVTPEGKEKATRRMEECSNGKKLMQQEIPCTFFLLDTTVNCRLDDYGPAITADDSTLFFTSRRNVKKKYRNLYASDGKYTEKIFRSLRDSNNRWDSARKVIGANFRGHFAVQGVSNDGKHIILYREKRGGDLYEAKLKKKRFSCPKRLPKCVNTKCHETSASYSYDGKTIYFCSNRPGGYGGHDIYKVTQNDKGKWKVVENMGSVINTPEDEISVFMHPDNKTMYFSSKGHGGMGGHDIYITMLNNGKWTKPVNLGRPINTAADEIYFVISASGRSAYYASSQAEGWGEEDIYGISFKSDKIFTTLAENQLLEEEEPYGEEDEMGDKGLPTPMMTLLNGQVRDKKTKEPISAVIELYDLDSNKKIADFESCSDNGKFLISLPAGHNYRITAKAEGYNDYSEDFDIQDSTGFQNQDVLVELEGDGKVMPADFQNIQFDFDKSDIHGTETADRLDKVINYMKAYPDVKVEVRGHTDNKGTEQYNQALSERRAKIAVDYIVEHGIDRSRLTSVGRGESEPIATNETEEGRALNRRVEFKIVQ
ncbi:MAG: PD40 domain-containing protein, partial [Bacteroidales bacterium]|nr:PD40 domain-containing protein [Bacteroidales bacterium]